MTAFENIRDALAKRALYRKTIREIKALPHEIAIEDLGLDPTDAKSIARSAVYGV